MQSYTNTVNAAGSWTTPLANSSSTWNVTMLNVWNKEHADSGESSKQAVSVQVHEQAQEPAQEEQVAVRVRGVEDWQPVRLRCSNCYEHCRCSRRRESEYIHRLFVIQELDEPVAEAREADEGAVFAVSGEAVDDLEGEDDDYNSDSDSDSEYSVDSDYDDSSEEDDWEVTREQEPFQAAQVEAGVRSFEDWQPVRLRCCSCYQGCRCSRRHESEFGLRLFVIQELDEPVADVREADEEAVFVVPDSVLEEPKGEDDYEMDDDWSVDMGLGGCEMTVKVVMGHHSLGNACWMTLGKRSALQHLVDDVQNESWFGSIEDVL